MIGNDVNTTAAQRHIAGLTFCDQCKQALVESPNKICSRCLQMLKTRQRLPPPRLVAIAAALLLGFAIVMIWSMLSQLKR